MVSYRKLPPDVYHMVKRSLGKDYILSQYPHYHESMLDSFEIVSMDGNVSVFYYKDGTLEVAGQEANPAFRRLVKRVNSLVSKKDYI